MFTMKFIIFVWFTIFSLCAPVLASKCGCKTLTACYLKMLDTLHDQDEAYCVEDAAVGTSTLTVYMKALQSFCGDMLTVNTNEKTTYDSRHLYEVEIQYKRNMEEEKQKRILRQDSKPTIVIDAGQEADTESVNFALFIIEQLVACQENKDMIEKVKWVIMPSTNPDGMEYSRYEKNHWRKNLRIAEDGVSFGVDISRNFDNNWGVCRNADSGFSDVYPGASAASENETLFIRDVLQKHKSNTKIYVSLRRDGHYIAYPNAHADSSPNNKEKLEFVAAEVASKVNMRSGGVHLFQNNSIYFFEGKPRCGHSVDYAADIGVPLAYEMRVFLGQDNRIMSKFQTMPRGYQNSLRNGYFTGIRELYNVMTNEKKYGRVFQK